MSIYGAVFLVAGVLWMLQQVNRSAYVTQAYVAREQPVPFSHAHHVGDVGIDCRYCHTSVETSAYAGIPPTKTCMNCHAQLYSDSPTLEPVRESFRTGMPIVWTRVHDLPDFVYFDHSIHVNKGVACVTCHGRVDRMALTWQEASLQMEWCVNCHRHPENAIQPRDTIARLDWQPASDRAAEGLRLAREYNVRTRTDCSTCHR
ncbi:MAG TPA: cytochrome c3 family protein [Patescibacteria group bacterium]|nr:cytochrome c3 family protein [Patescibacteria group bacterium]